MRYTVTHNVTRCSGVVPFFHAGLMRMFCPVGKEHVVGAWAHVGSTLYAVHKVPR